MRKHSTLTGPERLASVLGLEALPERWTDLLSTAFPAAGQADELAGAVEDAATGATLAVTVRPADEG